MPASADLEGDVGAPLAGGLVVVLRANERLATTSSARMPVIAIVVMRLDAGLGAAARGRA